ncbi:hypothetical protein V9T40_010287 [Parthenolecanium corni]|uniref:Uncharacterized protein n=1 Tax=Parthenolecanium corni TaxID=536013 RepID=A0AAN9T907_9HEMI
MGPINVGPGATAPLKPLGGHRWLSRFSAGCLIFWLDVSIFSWMSQLTSSWFNFCLVVSFFVQLLSHFSAGCLIFWLDVSFFGWMSHFSGGKFSAGCLIFWLDVSIFGLMSQLTSSWLNFHLIVSIFG